MKVSIPSQSGGTSTKQAPRLPRIVQSQTIDHSIVKSITSAFQPEVKKGGADIAQSSPRYDRQFLRFPTYAFFPYM
jgi:hypothetical protein